MGCTPAGAIKRLASRVGLRPPVFAARVAAGEKYCWRCRALHPIEAFADDKSRRDGLDPACRDSRNRAAKARYVARPRASKRGTFFAPTRSGDKRQARRRVNHHVEIGLLPHPNAVDCMDCGHMWKEGERRHEYDHFRGYGAAHQLDVQSVCTTCHHAREKARG